MRFTRVFGQQLGQLKRIVSGMGLSLADGEDVLQDVYLQALQHPGKWQGDEQAARWLMRVTVNRCLLVYRQQKRLAVSLEKVEKQHSVEEAHSHTPEEILVHNEQVVAIQAALEEMDEQYRVVLVLKYYCGMNATKIGDILELKPTTVRSRLRQGRMMMVKRLLEVGIER